MKKQDENLFKIGEIAKILGVTRKAILVYEDMGLLTPAVNDTDSLHSHLADLGTVSVRN